MKRSENLGMQTFDMSLFKLYTDGLISMEEALRNADSANNLRLKISFANGSVEKDDFELSLDNDKDEDSDSQNNNFKTNLNDPYADIDSGNMKQNDSNP